MNPNIDIPVSELMFSFSRSSGPGGQNVNKVNSKATLKWNVINSSIDENVRARFMTKYRNKINQDGEIVIQSERYRDQPKNVDDCLERLREMLIAVANPPKKRVPTKPTKKSSEARLAAKKIRSERKKMRQKTSY